MSADLMPDDRRVPTDRFARCIPRLILATNGSMGFYARVDQSTEPIGRGVTTYLRNVSASFSESVPDGLRRPGSTNPVSDSSLLSTSRQVVILLAAPPAMDVRSLGATAGGSTGD